MNKALSRSTSALSPNVTSKQPTFPVRWRPPFYRTTPMVHTAHANPTLHTAPSSTIKVDKVRRQTITADGSSEDWSYFLRRWKDYKRATKTTGKGIAIQLPECCDEILCNPMQNLKRSAGGSLTSLPENQILGAMKILDVREENVMVARGSL